LFPLSPTVLPSFLKVLSSPFIAQICDKTGMVRRPMMVLLALAILFFSGYFVVVSFTYFVLVTILFSVVYFAVSPLVESYAVRICDKYNLQYGRIRSVGSIVFIITSVLFGKYLDHFGYDNFLYFCIGSLFITFFAVFLLPREGRKPQQNVGLVSGDDPPLKFLLTSRPFIMFHVVLSLIQMSHGFIYVLGSYHWARQGIDNATIGVLWSIGVMAEILVFIFAGRIVTRVRPMYLLVIIAVFGVIRWMVLAVTVSLPLLFVVQTFHGLTYGASHLVAMYYLSSRVPDKYFMTAQSLYSSVPMGLSIGAVMLLSGPLYNMWGGGAYYVMAALCLMVLFIARFVRRVENEAPETN
ncbi:MAG: MFS transporter, partial [Emcibacter sp.]|nr:MFS transporter [Emcibacter sp.]